MGKQMAYCFHHRISFRSLVPFGCIDPSARASDAGVDCSLQLSMTTAGGSAARPANSRNNMYRSSAIMAKPL